MVIESAVVELNAGMVHYLYKRPAIESREPLILLHGLGATCETWAPVLDGLATNRLVVAPDLLGHGASSIPSDVGVSPQRAWLTCLAEFLVALNLRPVSIVGSSLGGLLAALLYFEPSTVTEKLVIVGSSSCFSPEKEASQALASSYARAQKAVDRGTVEAFRARIRDACYAEPDGLEAMAAAQLATYSRPGAVTYHDSVIEAMVGSGRTSKYRVFERLEEIAAPTLVIWGRQERRGSLGAAERGVGRMPMARLKVFEFCGHMPYIEQPTAFVHSVLTFLDGSDYGGSLNDDWSLK